MSAPKDTAGAMSVRELEQGEAEVPALELDLVRHPSAGYVVSLAFAGQKGAIAPDGAEALGRGLIYLAHVARCDVCLADWLGGRKTAHAPGTVH